MLDIGWALCTHFTMTSLTFDSRKKLTLYHKQGFHNVCLHPMVIKKFIPWCTLHVIPWVRFITCACAATTVITFEITFYVWVSSIKSFKAWVLTTYSIRWARWDGYSNRFAEMSVYPVCILLVRWEAEVLAEIKKEYLRDLYSFIFH